MAINCSSRDRSGRNTVAALLSLALMLCMLVQTAHAQDCWRVGPAHGGSGVGGDSLASSTQWDPDGAGPLPVSLVVGPNSSLGQVRIRLSSGWSTLGDVFNDTVTDLTVYNGHLYACGYFTQIGAAAINGIARWNGSAWVQVGTGLGAVQGAQFGHVSDMHVFEGHLYLGGNFDGPGTSSNIYVLAWNGTNWVNRPQPQVSVTDFHTFNGALHIACAANTVSGVFRFTGSGWQVLGGVANADVLSLTSHNSVLYAAGRFTVMNGISASRIARWNGSAWSSVAGGLSPALSGERITRLSVYNGQIIASGFFEHVNGIPMRHIARWDGVSTWLTMGNGIGNENITFPPVSSFEVMNNELIICGAFSRAGNVGGLDNIVRWNGTQFLPLSGAGLNARVRAFLPANNVLYAGGDFAFVPPNHPTIVANRILATNGVNITTLSQANFHGTNGNVTSLALSTTSPFSPGTLIVGGVFTSAGGVAASNIARFNLLSQEWFSMSTGFNAAVSSVAVAGGSIYAAGSFTASGATALPGIARWTGSAWVSPGNWTVGTIVALGTYDNKLLISRISPSAHGVSTFDGATLTTLGIANGAVRAFMTFEGDLIVGGDFTTMNGVLCNRIARRNRITGVWSQVGQGFQLGSVRALAIHDGQLYAGGSLVSTVAPILNRIARFNGSSWVSVAGGVDNDVWALASYGGRLHIGGDFSVGTISSVSSAFSPFWITSICGCYVNCDNSSTAPILNVDDFTCFINSFASAQSLPVQQQIAHYANCDRSSISPVLNVDDFTCFINRFAIGCP
jgi:trimeric autotransporter adhesin